jgi:hypothetical protein
MIQGTTLSDKEKNGDFEYTATIEKRLMQFDGSMTPKDLRILNEVFEEMKCQVRCEQMYQAESRAYTMLRDLQGTHIPTLRAHVEVPEFYPPKHGLPATSEYSSGTVPGLLLQYIPAAFTLGDLYAKPIPSAPRHHWQDICDQAVSIVQTIMQRGICNPNY